MSDKKYSNGVGMWVGLHLSLCLVFAANGDWSEQSQTPDSGSCDGHVMMDVEVLLYKFSHPSAEVLVTSEQSLPLFISCIYMTDTSL